MLYFLVTMGILFLVLTYLCVGVCTLFVFVDHDCREDTTFTSLYRHCYVKLCRHFCKKYPNKFYEHNDAFWSQDIKISAQAISDSKQFNQIMDIIDRCFVLLWPIMMLIESFRMLFNKEK